MNFVVYDLIEHKRQIEKDIATWQENIAIWRDKIAVIDRKIEAEALRKEQDNTKMNEEVKQPDFSMFKDTTKRLLTELWSATGNMVSQEDIRQNVIIDAQASDVAVRLVVTRAREEIRNQRNFHYEIKNIKKKGYQLVKREEFQSVSESEKDETV